MKTQAGRYGIKKGETNLICLVTTRSDGSKFRCYYYYETSAAWDYYDGNGNPKANVIRTVEPWDGESMIMFDNGD